MPQLPDVSSWLSRPVQGVFVIGVLVLVLAIPIQVIRGLIGDRLDARTEASAEVTSIWGGSQSVIGPRLVVPYRQRSTEGEQGAEQGFVNVLPASLTVQGTVTAQPLSRGLFTVPVYEAALRLRGRFEPVEWPGGAVQGVELLWHRAALVVELSEPRSVGTGSTVSWNGEAAELLPGAMTPDASRRGVHAPVTVRGGEGADFDVALSLRGSEEIWLVPFSRSTRVSLSSDWPHPSFSGAWLPDRRVIDRDGFSADWDVPFLGRDYPQTWLGGDGPYEQILASRFGVQLVSPVDHYRMSERSTKYAPLFLALTFGLLWLFDTLVGARIHPVQYLLVGAAMCMFYLLELSLSEHVGFVGAYAVAALGVIALIAAYTKAVLGSTGRGALMAASVALLYAYLFALLTLERYALLVGSLGLFSALATVMHLTRSIDWHRIDPRGERPVR